MNSHKYLIDTARIKSEGSGNTAYHNYPLAVTSYTWLQVEEKGLKIDSTNVSIIEAPVFSDFINKGNGFFTWGDGTKILQLIRYQYKSYVPAICGRHDATAQLSLVGSNICVAICNGIFTDNADFSQLTGLILSSNSLRPFGTPDKCLNITLNKTFGLKIINNSTN